MSAASTAIAEGIIAGCQRRLGKPVGSSAVKYQMSVTLHYGIYPSEPTWTGDYISPMPTRGLQTSVTSP